MTNRLGAITASVALLGVAALALGAPRAQAQATAATPVVAPGVPSGTPLDLASMKASTVQVDVTQWGLHPAPKGEKPALSVMSKEHVSLDTTKNQIRLEQFDIPAAGAKPAAKPNYLVADGTNVYELIGARNQFFKGEAKPVSSGVVSHTGLVSMGLNAGMGWGKKNNFTLGPDEIVDGKTLKTYNRMLMAARSGQKPGTPSFEYKEKIFVDPATSLPVRYVITSQQVDVAGPVTEIQRTDFANWKLNQPIEATLFAWNPPADSKEYVAPPKPVLLTAGTVAPDFTAEKWGGGMMKLSDYKGKVVVLDFWATWCGPCQKSMPHVQHVADSIKGQDVVVIGVCVWDEKDTYTKWVPEHQKQYTFQFGFDPAGRGENSIAGKMFGVSGIPTTYIIDKDGKVADAIVGYDDGDSRLEAALGKLGVNVPTAKVASAK